MIDPAELLGISKHIDIIRAAFPKVIEHEVEHVQKPLDEVQRFCDDKFKDVTGINPSELK